MELVATAVSVAGCKPSVDSTAAPLDVALLATTAALDVVLLATTAPLDAPPANHVIEYTANHVFGDFD